MWILLRVNQLCCTSTHKRGHFVRPKLFVQTHSMCWETQNPPCVHHLPMSRVSVLTHEKPDTHWDDAVKALRWLFFPPSSMSSRDSHGCHDNQLSGGLTNNSSNILNDNRAATLHCLDLVYSCYLATRLAALFFWGLLTEKPAALQVCIQDFKAAEFASGETQSRELSQHKEEKSESRWKGGKSVGEVEASCV